MLSLLTLFGFGDDSTDSNYLGGADAVAEALAAQYDTELDLTIQFGEPQLMDLADSSVETDLQVRIPASVFPTGYKAPTFLFPLPDNPEDDDEPLNRFLDDIGAGAVEDLAGMSIDGALEDGVVVPNTN